LKYIKTYFAAPYERPSHDVNVSLYFEAVAMWCYVHDAVSGVVTVPVLPLADHYLELYQGRSHAEWLALNFELVRGCERLVRLPGDSSVAEQEVAYARGLGLHVLDLHNSHTGRHTTGQWVELWAEIRSLLKSKK
jgi:hypothetical protein